MSRSEIAGHVPKCRCRFEPSAPKLRWLAVADDLQSKPDELEALLDADYFRGPFFELAATVLGSTNEALCSGRATLCRTGCIRAAMGRTGQDVRC